MDDTWKLNDLRYSVVPKLEREIENLKEEVANLQQAYFSVLKVVQEENLEGLILE